MRTEGLMSTAIAFVLKYVISIFCTKLILSLLSSNMNGISKTTQASLLYFGIYLMYDQQGLFHQCSFARAFTAPTHKIWM